MKSRLYTKGGVFIVILVLSILTISAVETHITEKISQGETVMAKVSGYFMSNIQPENIYFYRGHVRVPFPYDVAQINEEFYIYALSGDKKEGNYSIVIKGVEYYKGAQLVDEDIVMDSLISNQTADFSVYPGFIITKNDFYLKVQNLQDKKIDIAVRINQKPKEETSSSGGGFFASLFGFSDDTGSSVSENETSVNLRSGEIKKINFKTNSINESRLETVSLSSGSLSYDIPVYIIANETQPAEETKSFKFDPAYINLTMPTSNNTKRIIYLQNTGQIDLSNISLILSDEIKQYASLSITQIDELEAGETTEAIELSFNSPSDEKTIEGSVRAKTESELSDYLLISLEFQKNYIPLQNETESGGYQPARTKTCEELDGIICEAEQTCKGETQIASNGNCCLGECKEKSKSSFKQILGWTIVIILVLLLGWFFKYKYRGVSRNVDLLKVAEGR